MSPGRPLAVVTGASRGIGAAAAELLLDAGWGVVVTSREPEDLAGLAARGAHPVRLDLAEPGDPEAAAERILRHGTPRVLINNAGFGLQGPLEEVAPEEARRQLEANVVGPIALTRALLPALLEAAGQEPAPRIIMVTSVVADLHQPLSGWYAASKAALASLTDTLRLELRGTGVEVIEVRPGPVNTGWQAREAADLRRRCGDGPYRRWAEAVARRAEARAPRGAAPEEAARRILAAATGKRVPARGVVGSGVRLAGLASAVLPPKALDAALRAYFRFPRRQAG